jgi:hypothetical protein
MPPTPRPGVRTGRLRAADPFELIRWLARSQTDARKALAELVQNSLDAQARSATITRLRERGVTCLRMRDDGEGVIPEMARPEALAHIATHIGHSRKRNLTPEQRRELLLQGQYGIGLLGFWSIGAELELRSQVAGGEPWVLRMWEERPNFEVAPLRGRLRIDGTWTEVIVRRLHRPALASLTGRRIGDFLAAELRGQLLDRGVTITVHDRMARGQAQKVRRVEPVRFVGERLALPPTLPVPSRAPIRVELHLLPEGGEPGRVGVACGGTVVYEDIVQAFDGRLAHEPWTTGRLAGLLDFPDFAVAPGSRRGVLLDEAAEAFAHAVDDDLAPRVRAFLADDQSRRAAAFEVDLVQKLQRAFRDLPREAPEYDFFAVRARDGRAGEGPENGGPVPGAAVAAGVPVQDGVPDVEAAGEEEGAGDVPQLFPPGPLVRVEIVPARSRVERWGERRVRSRPLDAQGRRIGGLEGRWALVDGPGGIEVVDPAHAVFRATGDLGAATVSVVVRQGAVEVRAEARIEIVEEIGPGSPRGGIPEPRFVVDARGEWRSRLADGHWEVNAGHRDFVSIEGGGRRKLRYLAALLAKEVVLHSYPMPQGGTLLERLVSVLTVTERRLERG